jgi:L-lactate dehydrogenase complex protein LldF
MRELAHEIRRRTITNLEGDLEHFRLQLRSNGFIVHQAANAAEACQIAVSIAQENEAQLVAKSKSMTTEEIGLNRALEQAGIRVVETDLGEFIVQLRGEPPGHIITPAVHLSRADVAETFERVLGVPYSTNVEDMNKAAKNVLRKEFLSAQVGVSGVNFGVVESGTLCLITNEGNGRMVTTLPPVHIAIMGIERLVPTLNDLKLMLQLLPRSSTGQKISSYVTLIHNPRQTGDPDGPDVRHVILVDNGRRVVADSALSEALFCIRCGACLNACPVFREIGGHAFCSAYPGPIGSVISPGLFGLSEYGHLAKASSLCGACREVCPVEIDLPKLLLRVRDQYTQTVPQPIWMRGAMAIYTWLNLSPGRYRWAQRIAAVLTRWFPKRANWLSSLPPPFSSWTSSRHFPPFTNQSFLARTQQVQPNLTESRELHAKKPEQPQQSVIRRGSKDPVTRFCTELEALGGIFHHCRERDALELILAHIEESGFGLVLTWETGTPVLTQVTKHLADKGMKILNPELPRGRGPERWRRLAEIGAAHIGLTGATAGIAETGTLVIPSGAMRSQLASLLPHIHFAILRAEDIYPNMEAWLEAGGKGLFEETACVNLVSGPSRTADIEMTLTIGVHGPQKLIVVCIEE